MFAVSSSKHIDRDLPLIVSSYREILFNEVPILFSGKNKYGTHVIGSSVDEDLSRGLERYFHILVSTGDRNAFVNREVSYLDLLRASMPIYVIDKSNKGKKTKVSVIEFSKIPPKYLPTSKTLFPISAYQPTFRYSSKLTGGIADEHLALPHDVSATQNAFADLLDRGFNTLSKFFNFGVETKLEPATESSYAINFAVRISNYPNLFVNEEDLWAYLSEFVKFCIQFLPDEVDKVLNADGAIADTEFEKLFVKALEFLDKAGASPETRMEFEESIREDVLASPALLKPIADVLSKHNYERIEFENLNFPLGTIDSGYAIDLDSVIAKIDAVAETSDTSVKPWDIRVYSFNKHSGNGKAEIIADREFISLSISILEYQQDDPKHRTIIESMLENNMITVRGLMSFKNHKPSRLEIRA